MKSTKKKESIIRKDDYDMGTTTCDARTMYRDRWSAKEKVGQSTSGKGTSQRVACHEDWYVLEKKKE